MKPIKEFLGDTKPKNVETIRKALEKGEGVEFMEEVLAEAIRPTAMDSL